MMAVIPEVLRNVLEYFEIYYKVGAITSTDLYRLNKMNELSA